MDVEDRQSPFDATSDRHGQQDVYLSTDEDGEGKSPVATLFAKCYKMLPHLTHIFITVTFYLGSVDIYIYIYTV